MSWQLERRKWRKIVFYGELFCPLTNDEWRLTVRFCSSSALWLFAWVTSAFCWFPQSGGKKRGPHPRFTTSSGTRCVPGEQFNNTCAWVTRAKYVCRVCRCAMSKCVSMLAENQGELGWCRRELHLGPMGQRENGEMLVPLRMDFWLFFRWAFVATFTVRRNFATMVVRIKVANYIRC